MPPEAAACLHAIVEGRVQGVGFRAFVYDHALTLGLTGWVRNKGESKVEVWAEGSPSDVDRLLAYLQRGPSMAYVTHVEIDRPEPSGKYDRFMVISSAW
jgi:acylphosphatase